MPYTISDVDKHNKGLSDSEKEQWVAVANSVLSQCVEDGGEEVACAAKAIRQANGVLKKRQAEQESGGPERCVCPECGHEQDKKRGEPCRSVECPECGSMLVAKVEEEAESMPDENELNEAVWSTAFINNLPDSSFALILPGGEKDDEGKTVPRSLRKLPYKDADGTVDAAHLRNALARAPQMKDVSEAQKESAIRKLQAAAKKHLKSYQQEMEIVALALLLAESYDEPEDEPEGDELAETELAESASGYAIGLAEAQLPLDGNRAPVEFDLKIIAPGAGNKHDNHWYPAEMLKRDAHVFEGVDMFVTDHRENERSERTKVGRIKSIVGFTEDGGPIGRAVIYDPELAEKTRNRATAGELGTLHCSILAQGTAKKGEVEGRKYHIVEAITRADAVDLVSRAGAGGRALALAESESGGESMTEQKTEVIEEQEPAAEEAPVEEPLEEVTLQEQQEPVEETGQPEESPAPAMLEPEKVRELIAASNLPDAAKTKLSEAEYADEAKVQAAVAAEVAYIKSVTGSGKPFAQGAGSAPEHKPRTAEESDADWNRILTEVGMPYLAGG